MISGSILIKVTLLVLVILWAPAVSLADEIPLFYQGIRPLGMGGAFTAVAGDENAFFYNPAGLLRRGGEVEFELLAIPTLELGQDLLDIYQEGKQINDTRNESEKTDKVIDLIGQSFGDKFYLKASLFPHLIYNQIGVGFLAQGSARSTIHNPLGSNFVEAKATADLAVLLSYARPVGAQDRPTYIGITAKGVNRRVFEKSYTLREISEPNEDKNDIKEGTGVAIDLGFLHDYPMSATLQPTVGLSLQNIVGGDIGNAGKLPFQANVGVAFEQKMKRGDFLLAADIVDLTRNVGNDNNFTKRLHIGMEYQFPYILALRTGLYQGSPSYGMTVDFWIIHFHYAYYVEEIGAFAGQIPDARHVVKIALF